ncbi:MAG: flagellar FlbD family protein, partial [Spirochaetales bacterium]|nr:flagellar FlbD family protein [Spirochaetales bacterium]
EYIEENPDTHLMMLSGKKLVVLEDYQTVYNEIVEYRRQIGGFRNEE